MIRRYLARISGPLLDRIHLHIQVPAVKYKELAEDNKPEESAVELVYVESQTLSLSNEARGNEQKFVSWDNARKI